MSNMRNIIKIIITSMLLLMFSNIGMCETYTWTESGSSQENYGSGGQNAISSLDYIYFIIHSAEKFNDVKSYHEVIPNSEWCGGSENSKYNTVNFYIGAVNVGTGIIGWNKGVDNVYLNSWINWDLSAFSGQQTISMSNVPDIDTVHSGIFYTNMPTDRMILGRVNGVELLHSMETKTVVIEYEFTNYIHTEVENTNLINISIDKNSDSSRYSICDGLNNEIFNESSNNVIDFNLFCVNETIYVTGINEYGNILNYQYTYTPEDTSKCRIDVNDIDIEDTIDVSYFNINDLRENPLSYGNSLYETCDLNIQVIADRGYYEELIYQDLIIDESDNTFYYSSDTLSPGTYYAQINRNLGGLTDYAIRSTFTISEPANYSITVNPNTCYVGDKINIIYKSLNQSTLSVYDNNDKLIDNWLNIQGQSQKIYQVPPDYEYNNAYSNWYVMLNDTGNSSNTHRYNFTVNWNVYVEPEPTPEPTEPYYNESIEENVNELKDGFNPLLELVFGLSTIFVDNPDYNNDNIVDVNELSTWINSIVSIAIVIFLFILYKVYKRR